MENEQLEPLEPSLNIISDVLKYRFEHDQYDGTADELNAAFMQCVFAFIEANWKTLRGVCANSCRGQKHLIDEMFSDVVFSRVQNAFRTFDTSHGVPLERHVFSTVRWYCFKWMNERSRKAAREPLFCDLQSESYSNDSNAKVDLNSYQANLVDNTTLDAIIAGECKEEVQSLLSNLSPLMRRIVYLHDAMQWTHEEIGQQFGYSRRWADDQYLQAIKILRNVASRKQRINND